MGVKFEIKSRINGVGLFTVELDAKYESASADIQLGEAVKKAVSQNADLYGANLRSANLRSADLYGANLYGADLYGANLRSADLYGANLYGADLRSADLYGANLRSANLYGANLYGANLYGANLYGANLGEEIKASGDRPVFQLGPVGRYAEYITAFVTSSGPYLRSVDFNGPLSEFKANLCAKNEPTGETLCWLAAIQMIEAHIHAYPPGKE